MLKSITSGKRKCLGKLFTSPFSWKNFILNIYVHFFLLSWQVGSTLNISDDGTTEVDTNQIATKEYVDGAIQSSITDALGGSY